MKISIVSITRTHLLNLAIALDKKVDVDVVFYTLTPAFRLRKYGYRGKVISLFFPLGILVYGVKNLTKGFSPKSRLLIGHRFRKWFDISVSIFIRSCDILVGANGDALYTSKKAKKKYHSIVICDQGSSHINAQDKMYKELGVYTNPWNTENLLSQYAFSDYLMVPSEYVKKTDLENLIPANKILYNPYGVDCAKFSVTDKPRDDSYDVLMVGTWCIRKGCDLLLKAVLQMDGVRLLHVGPIIDVDFPKDDRFTHIDVVPESALPSYYSQAKVFVLPSRNEGLALVTLQACACGLPLVSSKNAGGIDIKHVLEVENPFFIIEEPISVSGIKDSIRAALAYADALPEGPRNQYGDVERRLSWAAYGERYYSILKRIFNKAYGELTQ